MVFRAFSQALITLKLIIFSITVGRPVKLPVVVYYKEMGMGQFKISGKAMVTLRMKLYLRDNGICQLCNMPVKFNEFTIDHIIPVSKGGRNNFDNLQVSHRKCNEEKADKIVSRS
jgi:CRISPR/Cas system Type II protein with McrA/HNH and RuvC-like nuclease domain